MTGSMGSEVSLTQRGSRAQERLLPVMLQAKRSHGSNRAASSCACGLYPDTPRVRLQELVWGINWASEVSDD